jgi:predicted porin
MKSSCFLVLVLGAAAAGVQAQTPSTVYRGHRASPTAERSMALIDVSDLFEPGAADTSARVFGFPGKRMGLSNAAVDTRPSLLDDERASRNSRAWGLSVGIEGGPLTLRIAHQNKSVAKVAPAMYLGNRTDAKNSIVAANIDVGPAKAYAAYSANRGWGSSPLFNPDNPYGAAMASTPSTDSRDMLVGMALPYGSTTLLASFVRRNDRDLANRDVDMLAFGATYKVSRKTDFYAAYSVVQNRTGADYLARRILDDGKGFSALNIGMRHSF